MASHELGGTKGREGTSHYILQQQVAVVRLMIHPQLVEADQALAMMDHGISQNLSPSRLEWPNKMPRLHANV